MLSKWQVQSTRKPCIINFNWILFYITAFNKLAQQLSYIPTLACFSDSTALLTSVLLKGKFAAFQDRHLRKPLLNRKVRYNSKFMQTTQLQIQDTSAPRFSKSYNTALFELYLRFTHISPTSFFKPHGNLQPFFILNLTGQSTFINVSKTYSRWLQFTNLIDNIFRNDLKCFIFSVKPLRQECTAFNWTEKCFDYDLFKKSTPYFFKKDTQFGSDSITIFTRFERSGLSTVFVTDAQYHWKNLYYLRRVGIYTISPIALNTNPWDVHFSLPVGSNNLLAQYFFVKLLTSKKHSAKAIKFTTLQSHWV